MMKSLDICTEVKEEEEEMDRGDVPNEEEEIQDATNRRPKWARKSEYMLSVIGYCVSLVNIWRFPYICSRNGGGAFLIPFVIFLVLCGLPLFFLEVCLGQFSGKSALHIWALCPLMKGLGVGMVLLSGVTCAYFTTVLSWTIYYLVRSCSPTLPWATCGNWWNTDLCVTSITRLQNHTASPPPNTTCPDNHGNVTDVDVATLCSYIDGEDADVNGATLWSNTTLSHTGAEEFWQYNTLGISRGLEEVGYIQWHLAVCLLAAWTIIFLSVIKGIHSVGKVVYVTATIPYILLVTLLVQGLMLPGGKEGVLVYLTPDFSRLMDIQVWLEACLQVFHSLGPAWGGLITMASYNDFHNNCLRDAIIATFVSEGTSMFGGLVVFSILGYISKQTGIPVLDVVSSGPGLGYVTYPEALTHLPVPTLWSFLFFAMLVFLAIDTAFSLVETCISAVMDHYPNLMRHRLAVTVVYCCLSYLTGLVFTTQGGMYMFQLIDWYLSFIFLLMTAFLECIVIAWIYGIRKFCADIEMMIGRKPPLFFKVTWCFITPTLLLTAFVFSLTMYKPPTYGKYKYPDYATTIGWFLTAIPVIPFVVMAIKALSEANGTILQRLRTSLTPDATWCPSNSVQRELYSAKTLMGQDREQSSEGEISV